VSMQRREVIILIGGAVAVWPLTTGAQQPMPVIGYLMGGSPGPNAPLVAAVRQGLSETGYAEGQNLAIEFRAAEGLYDRLPALAAHLVGRKVDVIVAGNAPSALAAKSATSTIPIVFASEGDPVQLGLVASFNRPGGNITGVSVMLAELMAKKLELLSELVPHARVIALLVNPNNATSDAMVRDVERAARAMAREVQILNASNENEIDAAFATLSQSHVGALLVGADGYFYNLREQLVTLAALHSVPAIYHWREFAASGGLIHLWSQPRRHISPDRHLRWENSQRRQARRSAGPAADDVRIGRQSQDRQDARTDDPAIDPRPGRRGHRVKRRAFMALFCTAAALSPAAWAQQPMPVIGYLAYGAPETDDFRVPAFRRGLNETGYAEGQNVTIEYRWALGQYERLTELAADLVQRRVSVIAAMAGAPPALAAKAATTTIPIVFDVGMDPVESGLVASLNRPGSNMTGVSTFTAELGAKRLQLLKESLPTVAVIAALVNPTNAFTKAQTKNLQDGAGSLGLQLHVLQATTESEIDAAFEALAKFQVSGLIVGADPFLTARKDQIVALAARHMMPAVYNSRVFTEAGGLMSYGTDLADDYRLAGVYTGKILKGANPADLPVQQAVKIELVINLKTAKALGLTIPLTLSGRADEVIE
jgi:putative ABC transport system substrate-binding protein